MPQIIQTDVIQLLSRHLLPSGFDHIGILKEIGDDHHLGHAYCRALIRGLRRANFKLDPWARLTVLSSLNS